MAGKLICRPLENKILAERFINDILDAIIDDEDGSMEMEETTILDKDIQYLVEMEIELPKMQSRQTLYCHDFRNKDVRDDDVREKLRRQIVRELINLERLPNDDDINLGHGGAKPIGIEPQKNKEAYYIIGLPATGKSGIANVISDARGAYILDSDMAKRKIPEYSTARVGASLVHEESDDIIFGRGKNGLFGFCADCGYNIVIPKIGHTLSGIKTTSTNLKDLGYRIFLVLSDADRIHATGRAYKRFLNTSRYVPLPLIFDGYGNNPQLNYFRLKQENATSNLFDGFLQVNTQKKEFTVTESINMLTNFSFSK